MMPDLGKYAIEVSAAYAVSLVALAVLVGLYVWRNARVRNALETAEARGKDA